MDHDPLCSWPMVCNCAIIARIRSDERAKIAETWQTNLAVISARKYEQGYNDRAKGEEFNPNRAAL